MVHPETACMGPLRSLWEFVTPGAQTTCSIHVGTSDMSGGGLDGEALAAGVPEQVYFL